ncbi:mutanobactin A system MFS transporter MubZ [Clostridium subterminale]|uniref:Mutanobactin A system MFS transporter MubZ n=1 Tax=Clostridium subterminale TaxID=1550 RepID=A0ABN1KPW6_CLOSU
MKMYLVKQRDFSLLIFGKLVSSIGSQMQGFALSLYVLSITGSATKFASVLAITIIPKLILGPIAGVFADWFDKKKMMVGLDILSGIIIGIFVLIYRITGGLDMIHIYILSITLSLIGVIFQPVTSSILPSIIKKEELVDGNGLSSFIMDLGNLMSPAIAGILMGSYGLYVILIINSISFILSGISESFIRVPKINSTPQNISMSSFVDDFKDGIIFIKNKKLILNIILLCLVINFAYNPVFSIGLTYISKQILMVSDFQYGLMESILVVSMLIAPFICSSIYNKFKNGKIYFYIILFSGSLLGILSIVPSNFYLNLFDNNFIPYVSIIVITFFIGLITTLGNIIVNTIVQEQVPLNFMGRVVSVMSAVCMAAIPFGQMIFGYMYDKFSASICILISSLILIITILLFRKSLFKCDNENEVENSLDEAIDFNNGEVHT